MKTLPPKPKKDKEVPGKFKCAICKIELSCGSDLAVHEAQHNKTTGYYIKCPRCSSSFTKEAYVAHFLCKHLRTSKRKECPICKVVALNLHHKEFHKIEEHSNVYKCENENESCQSYFVTAGQLIQYKRKCILKTGLARSVERS